jgi:uncharacterized protein
MLGFVYIGYAVLMTALHPQMIYPFADVRFERPGYQREVLQTETGEIWLQVHDQPEARAVALVFMGNSGVLAWHLPLLEEHEGQGLTVVALEYRGGGGAPGSPSEVLLKQDALAAFDFIRTTWPDAPILVHGYSLGTGLAMEVAAKREAVGVILDAPYAWLCQVMTARSGLPACFIPSVQGWASGNLAPLVSEPVLIRHGTEDELVPFAQGEKLAALFGREVTFVRLKGAGHGTLFRWPAFAVEGNAFLDAILSER